MNANELYTWIFYSSTVIVAALVVSAGIVVAARMIASAMRDRNRQDR